MTEHWTLMLGSCMTVNDFSNSAARSYSQSFNLRA